jgi:hypothetical protein
VKLTAPEHHALRVVAPFDTRQQPYPTSRVRNAKQHGQVCSANTFGKTPARILFFLLIDTIGCVEFGFVILGFLHKSLSARTTTVGKILLLFYHPFHAQRSSVQRPRIAKFFPENNTCWF